MVQALGLRLSDRKKPRKRGPAKPAVLLRRV